MYLYPIGRDGIRDGAVLGVPGHRSEVAKRLLLSVRHLIRGNSGPTRDLFWLFYYRVFSFEYFTVVTLFKLCLSNWATC